MSERARTDQTEAATCGCMFDDHGEPLTLCDCHAAEVRAAADEETSYQAWRAQGYWT